jgi:hypothetical protein
MDWKSAFKEISKATISNTDYGGSNPTADCEIRGAT